MPFRLAALRAGLELRAGTSPPVLQPVPGLEPAREVPERLDVVRGYLRLLGPATPKDVAGYLDAPVADVRARWPEDAVEVSVDGDRRWVLADDAGHLDAGHLDAGHPDAGHPDAEGPGGTRLLGPFDLFLQARDRSLLVPEAARARTLWPTLGRPGAVLADGEIVGSWRARRSGHAVTVSAEFWVPASQGLRAAVGRQAERLAAFRKARLAAVHIAD